MFCFKCGASMPDDSIACPQCAAPVANAPAPPPAVPPASPWLNPPSTQPQYPQGQPYAAPGQYYAQKPPTDGKATTSLVLGILSIVLCLGFLAGIPAVILGHMSRRDIQRAMGRLSGEGVAMGGLITGYIGIFLSLVFIPALVIPNLMRARIVANESVAISTLHTINRSQATYTAAFPEKGFAPDLASLGRLPGSPCNADHACLIDEVVGGVSCKAGSWCIKDGYKFSLSREGDCTAPADNSSDSPSGCTFVVVATPVNLANGRRSFCSTSDAVIRFQSYLVLSRPISAQTCAAWTQLSR